MNRIGYGDLLLVRIGNSGGSRNGEGNGDGGHKGNGFTIFRSNGFGVGVTGYTVGVDGRGRLGGGIGSGQFISDNIMVYEI